MQEPAGRTDPGEVSGSSAGTWEAAVRVARAHGGWIVALAGVLLCAAGWYGVSGESVEAEQVPYLASATIPGAALIVAGAVLVAGRAGPAGGGAAGADTRRRVAELHALFLEPEPQEAQAPEDGASGLVTVPGGGRYHRAGCPLTAGHEDVETVSPERVAELGLEPCPLCDPPPLAPAASETSGAG